MSMVASIPVLSASPGVLLAILWVSLVVPQVVLTLWFLGIVRHRTRAFVARLPHREESAGVPAEVILCLRGCDPTLDDVFTALANQSHRAWRLRVIVDSVDDPAWNVAQAAVSRLAATAPSWRGHRVEPLASRPSRGSLKCASLRQALRSLSPETRVVALIDADSVVHRHWLLTMVDECLRPGVGAVSGNRWYDPVRDTPAAIVRVLWNAGAIVQMTTFGIPWGGSLAVRREALDDCRWADVIEGTLCEDTALAAPLARSGWKYRFIPALTAIDRDDDVSFGPLTRWIARQLLTARLHHPSWGMVAIHGIATSIALAAAVVGCVQAGVMGNRPLFATLGGSLLAYEAVNLLLLFAIARAIRTATGAVEQRPEPLGRGRALRWAAMIPATQCVYAIAMASAISTRAIEWRGIIYTIKKKNGSIEVVVG